MKTGALSADVHCCAVMPREASPLLPEHLQPLHAAICDARDQGLDADALPFLEALASTLHAANSLLGGGDARTWTTVRRAREDEITLSLSPPMPRPGGGVAAGVADGGGDNRPSLLPQLYLRGLGSEHLATATSQVHYCMCV